MGSPLKPIGLDPPTQPAKGPISIAHGLGFPLQSRPLTGHNLDPPKPKSCVNWAKTTQLDLLPAFNSLFQGPHSFQT